MPTKSRTVLYAGPSLNDISRKLIQENNIRLLPPIERHQIPKLSEGFQGTIIIADGVFRQNLAVGHAEIRHAITRGIRIWGLSSMGAIRAYEMQTLGMRGYGKVFDWFQKEEDFQDDEVALLHSPVPPYASASEPLVHFRECLIDLIEKKSINQNIADLIIGHLKNLFFGDRTMDLFFQLLEQHKCSNIRLIKKEFNKYRIKEIDLELFLRNRIWDK